MSRWLTSATLADVNLWLATLHEGHPHHRRAVDWWRSTLVPGGGTVTFCRVTQLGLLRLLCNDRVMGPSRRSPAQAWNDYRALMTQHAVQFADEPDGIESIFVELTEAHQPSSGLWTDAYLAAFAIAGNQQLATFDRGFRRFRGLRLELLG